MGQHPVPVPPYWPNVPETSAGMWMQVELKMRWKPAAMRSSDVVLNAHVAICL